VCESFLHDVNLLIGDIRWVGLDRGAYCAPCRARSLSSEVNLCILNGDAGQPLNERRTSSRQFITTLARLYFSNDISASDQGGIGSGIT
jgi:hypothetical protein